jgi:hypothetical protein
MNFNIISVFNIGTKMRNIKDLKKMNCARKMNRVAKFAKDEISNFYTILKEVTHWGVKPEIPRKEREGE